MHGCVLDAPRVLRHLQHASSPSFCQVRFHPLDSDILASGSLDHRVVVWRVSTGEKLYVHDFGECHSKDALSPVSDTAFTTGRSWLSLCHTLHVLCPLLAGKPIASIAFHPSGKALVVASGHKVQQGTPAAQQHVAVRQILQACVF